MAKKREQQQPREYTKRQLSHHKKEQRRQKIILISGITVIAAVVLIILSGWFFGEIFPMSKTIATVYDTKIKERDLVDALEIVGRSYASVGQTVDLSTQTDYILKDLIQYELNKQAAAKLGISVSNDEVAEKMKDLPDADNKAGRSMVEASLLLAQLQDGYFAEQVGDNAAQVSLNAMLVESEEMVPEIRARLAKGEDFSTLTAEFALNTTSKNSKGVFDWHPYDILKANIGSAIPVDWAFTPDVKPGDISTGLTDDTSYKQLGYWLIKVTYRAEGEADTQTLLVTSKAQAEYLKPLLEATEDISALADQYTQYSPSKSGHGTLHVVDTDNISDAYNGYVFNEDTPLNVWSDPIQETHYWTQGGAWVAQAADKEDSRALTVTDKDTLISNAYNKWSESLWDDTTAVVYKITDEQKTWAINKANERITAITGS